MNGQQTNGERRMKNKQVFCTTKSYKVRGFSRCLWKVVTGRLPPPLVVSIIVSVVVFAVAMIVVPAVVAMMFNIVLGVRSMMGGQTGLVRVDLRSESLLVGHLETTGKRGKKTPRFFILELTYSTTRLRPSLS